MHFRAGNHYAQNAASPAEGKDWPARQIHQAGARFAHSVPMTEYRGMSCDYAVSGGALALPVRALLRSFRGFFSVAARFRK